MRFLVNDLLGCALVHVGVRFELEGQVEAVDKQQDDTSATADFQDAVVGLVGTVRIERGMEGSL